MPSSVRVVAALVLSIQVALFYTIPMEELTIADYRDALIEVPTFRKFVLVKLEEMNFMMTVDVGPDKYGNPDVLNITEILNHSVCIGAVDGGGVGC